MAQTDTETTIHRIREEYADAYDTMTWLTPEKAAQATRTRDALIHEIFNHAGNGPQWRFAGTKLTTHGISPGCNFCGQGGWSCLFINGICNARCFYCPSVQDQTGHPMTSTLEFRTPEEYVAYVEKFDIQAVSFSGGEPFMTFDRVVKYLKALRAKISRPLYIWMYTNGLLVTGDKLKLLAENGLDEIRFDISANHYRLDALKKAVGVIPHVTVEIPAIPEDLDNTRQVIRHLHDEGVNFLNLHQLRCTPFNLPKLIRRGYTFLHGPKVTVLETELTALELIRYSLDQKIALPINYCSFTFRHQFQRAGALNRNARLIQTSHQGITATGHIRTLCIFGDPAAVHRVHQHLQATEPDTGLWEVSSKGDRLKFHETLWPKIDFTDMTLEVTYTASSLKSSVSFRHSFKEIALNRKKKVVIEKYPAHPVIRLKDAQISEFGRRYITGDPSPGHGWDIFEKFENFASGLSRYY
ncbi:MAG: radical SAM protein [Desulfotignum sp.]|nr:radical SAM protein [Desulfotignum sp.]